MGNEIEIDPQGFKIVPNENKEKGGSNLSKAIMYIKVMNKGLSDQLVNNIELKFVNPKFTIAADKNGKSGEISPAGQTSLS